jgi:hypothetical protein
MSEKKRREEGQVLVIVVVAIIALLAFVALAVDGGLAYVDRRSAQNAADAGALAGAWKIAYALEKDYPLITYGNWSCGASKLTAAREEGKAFAVDQVELNDYIIDLDITDDNGIKTTCYEINFGTYVDKYLDVEVRVTSGFDTAFAQLIGTNSLTNTVTAITRIRPRTALAFGYAIVALNEAGCSGNSNGGVFMGTSDSYINGGGVFSNGCLKSNGSSIIDVTDGSVGYVGTFTGDPTNFDPLPDHQTTKIPASSVTVPEPDCNAAGMVARTQGSSPLLPGRYTSITINNGTWDFQPGLYCITGTGDHALRINGGTITGDNVTFFFTRGGLTFNGNANINLSAPTTADHNPAIQGILIYGANGNSSEFTMNGTSDSHFVGTIFAPSGNVEINGTGDLAAYQSQIIAYNVFISGTADIGIFFSPDQNYQTPALLDLQQ